VTLTGAFDILPGTECQLGESPVWDAVAGALLWADIPAGTIHELTLATSARRRWTLEGPVGSFGLAQGEKLIVARRHEVGFLDRATGTYETLAVLFPPGGPMRLNDGKVGPDGAFWVGAMDESPVRRPIAALYRVDQSGAVTTHRGGLFVSNGLAWSPDGTLMYHSDSRGCWIECWGFESGRGVITNPRRFATLAEADGRPDGAAMDAEGFYWSAGVSAGCLNRFAPDGRLDARITLPVPAPTMPCFGGADLRTLFVTSLSPATGGNGAVLAAQIAVPGAAVNRFAG
jgi:sugar lactone lactonase YvrE